MGSTQRLKEVKKNLSQDHRTWCCQHLHFRFFISKAVRVHFCCLKPLYWDNFFLNQRQGNLRIFSFNMLWMMMDKFFGNEKWNLCIPCNIHLKAGIPNVYLKWGDSSSFSLTIIASPRLNFHLTQSLYFNWDCLQQSLQICWKVL